MSGHISEGHVPNTWALQKSLFLSQVGYLRAATSIGQSPLTCWFAWEMFSLIMKCLILPLALFTQNDLKKNFFNARQQNKLQKESVGTSPKIVLVAEFIAPPRGLCAFEWALLWLATLLYVRWLPPEFLGLSDLLPLVLHWISLRLPSSETVIILIQPELGALGQLNEDMIHVGWREMELSTSGAGPPDFLPWSSLLAALRGCSELTVTVSSSLHRVK